MPELASPPAGGKAKRKADRAVLSDDSDFEQPHATYAQGPVGLKELEEQQVTRDRDHWNAFELRDQRPRKLCTALERQLVQDKPQEPGA